jgi:hypothetical protein
VKRKSLRELARNPQFIPGIYNYCDRWCERCSMSHRCLTYASESAAEGADTAARDSVNQQFWDRLHQHFQETMEMMRGDAKAHGIDLDDPKLQTSVAEQQRAERRWAAKNLPLVRKAMVYSLATDKWFVRASPLLEAKVRELKTQLKLEIGDPHGEAERLIDVSDVIRWYQHFVCVKLRRAIESRAGEELDRDAEFKKFPKDSEGSAKIALIAMDRSIAAWSVLRDALGGDDADGILDLLAQLAAIRRETEKLFPHARSFVRPGFGA